MSDLLSERQEMFCQYVAQGMPLTRAYIAAGYAEKAAESSSSRLARNAKVASRIGDLKILTLAKLDKEKAELAKVRKENEQVALENIAYTIEKWRNDIMLSIQQCEERELFATKAKYQEMLAKHIGAYEADNRQRSPQTNVGISVSVAGKDAAESYNAFIKNKS